MEFEITAPVYSHRGQTEKAAGREKKPSLYHTFVFSVKAYCLYNPQCTWTAGGSVRDCVTLTSSLTTTWEWGCRGLVNSLLPDSTRSSDSTSRRHVTSLGTVWEHHVFPVCPLPSSKCFAGTCFYSAGTSTKTEDVNLIKCQCDLTWHLIGYDGVSI